MTHLFRQTIISTQWPRVHTMPSAAVLSGAQKRRSVCEQTFIEGILGMAIPMSLPNYIVGINKINDEDQGQAGQVT